MLLLVSVHADLVTPNNGLETILVAELLGDVGSKLHAYTTLAGASPGLFLRIRPQHLHHEALLTRLALLVTVDLANVVQRHVVVGEETAVEHKVLSADQSSERQS